MTHRDPRTDPQKGDVVYRRLYYTVTARAGRDVRVLTLGQRRGEWWTLDRWTAFASAPDATSHAAPSPRPRKSPAAPDRVELGPAEAEILRQVMDPNNPKGKRRRLTPKRER